MIEFKLLDLLEKTFIHVNSQAIVKVTSINKNILELTNIISNNIYHIIPSDFTQMYQYYGNDYELPEKFKINNL